MNEETKPENIQNEIDINSIEGKKLMIKKFLSMAEPLLHEVYGRTMMLHDVQVLANFVQTNLWMGLADRSQANLEAHSKYMDEQEKLNSQQKTDPTETLENGEDKNG